MREIGSWRLTVAILLAIGVGGCGPSEPKTPDDRPSEGFAGEGGSDGASGGEEVEPADHDIEVPPAP